MRALPMQFFERDARTVARELLGKYLVRKEGGKTRAYRIVETEAYLGPHDKASHSSKGRTARTEVMFGPPGRWYVYFTYGMHFMLNIVTGPEGYPAAVLIRGLSHSSILQKTRIINGPGRLTKALGIDKTLNGKRAVPATGLWIEDHSEMVAPRDIIRTARIGVGYAGEWAKKPLRYVLADIAKIRKAR